MKLRALPLLAALLAAGAAGAAPLHDPFVEGFLVGAYADPAEVVLQDGRPADLLSPARPDSAWLDAAVAARADAGALHARLLAAWPDPAAAGNFAQLLDRVLGDLSGGRPAALASPDDPFAADQLSRSFFAALADGDSSLAIAAALLLASDAVAGVREGTRCVWALRAATLADDRGWSGLESLLAGLGPWDAGNVWSLGIALRRGNDLPRFGPGAGDGTALELGRMNRTWLDAADLDAAPFADETRGALGSIVLPRADLDAHFARWPNPPVDSQLQGWWTRGQRRLHPGDADHYEALARRSDLAPVWQMDLWRRASERRLLGGLWPAGLEDLTRALRLAAQPSVAASPSGLVRDWTEQAFALAQALERPGDAARILALARQQALVVKDERFRSSVRLLEAWQDGSAPRPDGADRVDSLRLAVRDGRAADARAADAGDRERLVRAGAVRPWALWRRWGMALSTASGLPPERQAAADRYHQALSAAADPGALLGAAVERLASRPGVLARLTAWALDQDIQRRSGGQTPPLPSPVPELAAQLRDSQADLHALLGVALALDDLRGTLGAASLLSGTGLTRDEKRRFLYPLPGPGPVLDALLAADDDPALLLAIARNESLFEPAVRSRAGALGWMQIMPFHYLDRGARPGPEHWSNPRVAIARGAALVAENRRRYGGDPYRLLAAYNAGPEAVARWDAQLGGTAARRLFLAWIGYTETRDYVEKVLIDRDLYDWILTENAPTSGGDLPAKE